MYGDLYNLEATPAESTSFRLAKHDLKRYPDIITAAKTTGCIVTAEEHNILGGLGAAVAEVVCENCPVPVLRVGVEDKFGKSGKVPALLEAYGLTTENIVAKAKAAIAAKKN